MTETTKLTLEEIEYTLQVYAGLVEYYLAMKNGSYVTFYTRLADKLSTAVNRPAPWSWRYVQGVFHGTVDPSRELSRAIMILAAEVDGVPAAIARLEKVDVYAESGKVQHGAIIAGASRVCAALGCNRVFVPNTPLRKYCPICRPSKRSE